MERHHQFEVQPLMETNQATTPVYELDQNDYMTSPNAPPRTEFSIPLNDQSSDKLN